MQNQRSFDEISEDEYIEGKGYNDGNHNVWIAKTTNPRARSPSGLAAMGAFCHKSTRRNNMRCDNLPI